MQAKSQKEHEWLRQLLGQWTMTSECEGAPGEPPTKSSGTETVRALGDLWIVCEGRGEIPGGGPGEMLMTLGYDPEKKAYQGTWAGSMMTTLWIYRGTLDTSGKVLALDTEGRASRMTARRHATRTSSPSKALTSARCIRRCCSPTGVGSAS